MNIALRSLKKIIKLFQKVQKTNKVILDRLRESLNSRSFTREFKFKSYYIRIKIIKFYEEGIGKIH